MREEREARRKRKRRKKIINSIVLLVFVLAVGSLVAVKVANSEQSLNPKVAENSSKKSNKKNAEKKEEPKQDPNKLMKGSNHILKADSYAYDAKTISQFIRPTKSEGYVKNTDNKKICFLTFDDGPNHSITPQVLDVLKKENVPATFFVVGKHVSQDTKDILERQLNEGHAIALHSFEHDYSKLYPGRVANSDRIKKEAEMAQKALQDVLGPDFKTSVWRYPGGHMSWQQLKPGDDALESLGIHWIDWNSLVGDAEPKSRRPTTVEGMVEFANTSLTYQAEQDLVVVLCHDAPGKQLTVDSLSAIIKNFKDKGYEFGILK